MGAVAAGEFADRKPFYQGPAAPDSARAATAGPAQADELPITHSVSEDQLLLHRLRKADRDALEAIVRRHQLAVYGYLRARLLQPADAEDLCQEVFLRCYAGKVKFDRTTKLRPWLIGVARNVLREHVRRQARSKEVAWTQLCLELDALAQEQPAGEHAAMEHLPGCLAALGQSAREALDMRYGASLRMADIGQRLRRSEGAVKLLIFRARQALRNCLDLRLRASETT